MRRWLVGLVLIAACGSDEQPRAQAAPMQPIAIQTQLVEPRIAAIGNTVRLSPELQRAFDPAGDFEPMPDPGPDDWLAQHPEKPQSYGDFLNASTHVPGGHRTILYVLPIGEFPAGAPSVAELTKIVHAFFTLEVRILPTVRVSDVPAKTRINPSSKQRQLLAPDVLAWLKKRLPDDAFALEAITMIDLYPQESWNFVFGMASLSDRVGVQSFARQSEEHALRRAAATMVHEISHMFGLTHCVYWKCVVAGSNHQAEADSRPLHLCPVCLHKLYSAIGFDPAAREEALAKVWREVGINDEAAWSERRAKWIRTSMH